LRGHVKGLEGRAIVPLQVFTLPGHHGIGSIATEEEEERSRQHVGRKAERENTRERS
jgi:hypothetical protein